MGMMQNGLRPGKWFNSARYHSINCQVAELVKMKDWQALWKNGKQQQVTMKFVTAGKSANIIILKRLISEVNYLRVKKSKYVHR